MTPSSGAPRDPAGRVIRQALRHSGNAKGWQTPPERILHQCWIAALSNALNQGGLPFNYFALVERDNYGPIIQRNEAETYAERANHIAVRRRQGGVVAVMEIVSPGNKGSHRGFRAFMEKIVTLLR